MKKLGWMGAGIGLLGVFLWAGCGSKQVNPAGPAASAVSSNGIATSPGIQQDGIATSPGVLSKAAADATPDGTTTASPTLTPSVTATPAAQGILLWSAVIYRQNNSNMIAAVDVQVDGSPATSAGVTLTGPDGPHALVYNGINHSTVKGPTAFYYLPGQVAYQPGASYTFSASTSEGVASFTGTAPGGSMAVNSTGTTATWAVEGTSDVVDVINAATNQLIYSPEAVDVDSPLSIPASVYSGYSSPTTFKVSVVARSVYNWTNVVPGNGYATIEDILVQNVVLPISSDTPTSTPTWTPTFTPTATPTPIPTPSQYTYFSQWGAPGTGPGQFNWPVGVAVNKTTNQVYVLDQKNNRVQVFDANGGFIRQWGSLGSGQGQFNYPQGIALDSQGNVFVTDSMNHRFQIFDAYGRYLAQYSSNGGPGAGQLGNPMGITVESVNSGNWIDNVYVADQSNKRVEKFQFGKYAFFNLYYVNYSTQWPIQFQDPDGCRAIVFNGSSIYLGVHQYIEQFDTNGHYLYEWGVSASAVAINGITVDDKGTLLETQTDHWVVEFLLKGLFSTVLAKQGTGNGQFYEPMGMAVDGSGYLYICDRDNNRIQKFSPN